MRLQRLRIRHPDAVDDPYPVAVEQDLLDAVGSEASMIAADAGSELLEAPDQECRDELRDRIVREALVGLRSPGRSYRDPQGYLWTLEDA